MCEKMSAEEAALRADRLVKELREAVGPGYKGMIASHGGVEGYLRWVRGYDDPPSQVDHWIMTGRFIPYSEDEPDR
jgi:hypothetical protein